MNVSHSRVTDWGLGQISVGVHDIVLDVGCGGGRTITKLASVATRGKVYGIDHSDESVAASTRSNASAIESGRVDIRQASVSQLPFSTGTFDLVTAVETHFWWPDVPDGLREILRVLKPGGRLVVIAEVYKGANTVTSRLLEKHAARTGLTLLSVEEHRQFFTAAAYSNIQVNAESNGWICATGTKPSSQTT